VRFTSDTQPVRDRPGDRGSGNLRIVVTFRGGISSEALVTVCYVGSQRIFLARMVRRLTHPTCYHSRYVLYVMYEDDEVNSEFLYHYR
jgi:hypothetical protein